MNYAKFQRASILCIYLLLMVHTCFAEPDPGKQSIPRPEHPKPQFQRANWINLNGAWNFAFDFEKKGRESGYAGRPREWDKQILVPFCPESELSGIGHTDFIPAAWYSRTFNIPESWPNESIFLHFGGVDYESQIWVNGKLVGHHYGGAVSFYLDISESFVDGENELVVYVQDDVHSGIQPLGKQSRHKVPSGTIYSRVTGIWQTVWLESRPESHIESVHVIPNLDDSRFILTPVIQNFHDKLEFKATLRTEKGKIVASAIGFTSGLPIVLDVVNPRVWEPDDPYLYTLEFELLENGTSIDYVNSYTGLRKVHVEGNKLFLNNKPIFLRMALDQGYYQEGLWTAPSDEALKKDIENALAIGLNGARLHQKVFEERFHYWADKLGYLTWAEFPDWGLGIVHKTNAPISPEGIANHKREWRDAILRDRNHPSIITWTPFNETGDGARVNLELHRRAIQDVVDLTRALDPTRPLCDASGHSHVDTDIYGVHDYENNEDIFSMRYAGVDVTDPESAWHTDFDIQLPYSGQPYIVAEYGGVFWEPDYAQREVVEKPWLKNWAYGKSSKAYVKHLEALTAVILENPNIAGFCLTQLYDIEAELNGLYTYDRKLKFRKRALKKIFAAPAAIEAK